MLGYYVALIFKEKSQAMTFRGSYNKKKFFNLDGICLDVLKRKSLTKIIITLL